jgi:hypothetical protein
MGEQPVARPLPTQDNRYRINADKHPRLERDLDPRSRVLIILFVVMSENKRQEKYLDLRDGTLTGRWNELHNERLQNFHSPPNIITVITSMLMRWVVHAARLEKYETWRLC